MFTQVPSHRSVTSEQAQCPYWHTWSGRQAMPHPPQLSSSAWVLVQNLSHPFAGLSSPGGFLVHSVVPAAQTQLPPTHSRPGGHAFPHSPQFAESVCGSTQSPLQKSQSLRQSLPPWPMTSQTPLMQYWEESHRVSQVPQWVSELRRSKQSPLHHAVGADSALDAGARHLTQPPFDLGLYRCNRRRENRPGRRRSRRGRRHDGCGHRFRWRDNDRGRWRFGLRWCGRHVFRNFHHEHELAQLLHRTI